MAAISDQQMDSLLSSFDQIYEDFKSGIREIEVLRSNCNAEIKRREALEITCSSLKQENERLMKMYTESLNNLADQLECRTKCQSLKEELKKVNDENLIKEYEHRKALESLNQDYAAKVGELEDKIRGLLLEKATNEAAINHLHQDLTAHKSHIQALANRLDQVGELEDKIRGLLLEKATNEAAINHLHQDLTAHKSHIQALASRLDQIHSDEEANYCLEIQDLRDCLVVEQEEKNELNKRLQDLQKELLISRTKFVEQQRDLASNRQVETLKLKLMKLRKENEILKRKLSSSEEG